VLVFRDAEETEIQWLVQVRCMRHDFDYPNLRSLENVS
jgi:hypothetical protein